VIAQENWDERIKHAKQIIDSYLQKKSALE
jgi:nicotinamide riboside kinase